MSKSSTSAPVLTATSTPKEQAAAEVWFRSHPKADRKAGQVTRPTGIPATIISLGSADLYALAGMEPPAKRTWEKQTPAEELAERTQKLAEHNLKLTAEQGELEQAKALLAQAPAALKAAAQAMVDSAEKWVTRRMSYIALQQEAIAKLGGTVPAKAKAKRTRKTAA